jgi:hypothetical protein
MKLGDIRKYVTLNAPAGLRDWMDRTHEALGPVRMRETLSRIGLHERLDSALLAAAECVRSDRLFLQFVSVVRDRIYSDQAPAAEEEFESLPALHTDHSSTDRSDHCVHLLYALAFLAGFDTTEAIYESRAIPEAVLRATMGVFSECIDEYAAEHGVPGLGPNGWLLHFFRGRVFQLGRLQFLMEPFPHMLSVYRERDGDAVQFLSEVGCPDLPDWSLVLSWGWSGLSVHVPATGKLTPGLVADAFRLAAGFFPRHFPEYTVHACFITSWLMDPQLPQYLPAESNIVQFQRLWHLFAVDEGGDEQFFKDVFPGRPRSWDAVTPETSLQRALIEHVRKGGQWHESGGVLIPARSGPRQAAPFPMPPDSAGSSRM